jgi:hypothetical protein
VVDAGSAKCSRAELPEFALMVTKFSNSCGDS